MTGGMRRPEPRPLARRAWRHRTGRGRGRPDLAPLTAAQRELAGDPGVLASARRLAAAAARRRPGLADEYESAALLALAAAARRYDPAKGAWADYAAEKVVLALRDVRRLARPLGFRRAAGGPAVGSLDAPLGPDDGGRVLTGALLVPGREPGRAVEAADHCAALLRFLTDRQRAAVALYFGIGCAARPLAAVGAELGVSEGRASRVVAEALEWLRLGGCGT